MQGHREAGDAMNLVTEHSYYCSTENYHSGSSTRRYKTFDDFIDEWGGPPDDHNLVFRWDVRDDVRDTPGGLTLEVFFMLQRKGAFIPCVVDITAEDLPAIEAWLAPHWEHMRKLWAPFSGVDP